MTTSIEQTYAATGKIAAGKEAGTGAAASTASSSDSTSATAAGTASLSSTDAADYPVKEVYVKVGDTVEEGQTVITIEAMKMETATSARMAGTVKEICVSEGDTVKGGQLLMRIE